MKNIKFTFLMGILLSCLLIACEQEEQVKTENDFISHRLSSTQTIPFTQFEDWKHRWQNSAADYMADNEIHYFDIPISSVTDVTNQGNLDHVRAYLGLDSETLPHLMLLGVVNEQANFNIITDYTTACPILCGEFENTNVATSSSESTQTIPYQQFEDWTDRWQSSAADYMANNEIHYFDIPIQSVIDVMNQEALDKVRAYLAMDTQNSPHLLLVGLVNGQANFNIITDYTSSCPPHCFD